MFPEFEWGKDFQKFIDSLDEMEEAILVATIDDIETNGLQVAKQLQLVKQIEKNLYEVRAISSGISLRGIYFRVVANRYFLVHGLKKKTQKLPNKDIKLAKKRRDNYLRGE